MTDADVVRNFYACLRAGDAPGAARLLSPEVILHVPGRHPLAGDYRGPTGLFEFAASSRRIAAGGDQTELVDVLSGSQFVAALCRVRATRPGSTLDNQTIHLAKIESGRIVEIWFHNFDQHAVDAFWSTESSSSERSRP